MSGGMYLAVSVVIDDGTRFSVLSNPALFVEGWGMGGTLCIQVANGEDSIAVSNRLLTAVTEWRNAVHDAAARSDSVATP